MAKKERYVIKYLLIGFIFMWGIVFARLIYDRCVDYLAIEYEFYMLKKNHNIDLKAAQTDIELFKRGIKWNIPQAMYGLGEMYHTGREVAKDLVKAIELYTRAAEMGERLAQYNLGRMYRTGEGVAVDLEKARYYYELSAAQDYNLALSELSDMYKAGEGVEVDLEKAEELLQKSLANVGVSMSYKNQIRIVVKAQLGEVRL